MSTDILIIVAGLFVVTIVAMMFGSSGLVPSYGFEGKQLRSSPFEGFADPTTAAPTTTTAATTAADPTAAPYEGFKQAMEYFQSRDNEEDEGFASLNSGDYTKIYAGVSSVQSSLESSAAVNYGAPLKVTGFDGVQGGAQVENSGMMGFLGPNSASIDCKSMGYTKSTGNVCFSPADIQLLTTRGGNFK
jgi:hypothetical protein